MTSGGPTWTVRLSAAAERDFQEILRWTADRFGLRQANTYARVLSAALEALVSGPTIIGVRQRNEIAPGLLTLHVARTGNKGRHFVLFRITPNTDERTIDVLRLLHDSMDISRHLPAVENEMGEP
ncbi:type II toxin-antitoxin system RelE/ParE family toxin [Rhodospirillum centenum]|uniref:Plasmid stabilization system protein, RelE n=1 Tax=Rhodospirillum centenum (strain ATCC 51521 / SW) TaxID=414684 RepID=B6IPZ4_RHOCS|nr:type II toxin-antitoxin system RelE/ParE family toxin [Rhodospirillum centenum]ACI97530.1 plasmid stabilization system protein, RelE [Rhodospirillum centenum SW]